MWSETQARLHVKGPLMSSNLNQNQNGRVLPDIVVSNLQL